MKLSRQERLACKENMRSPLCEIPLLSFPRKVFEVKCYRKTHQVRVTPHGRLYFEGHNTANPWAVLAEAALVHGANEELRGCALLAHVLLHDRRLEKRFPYYKGARRTSWMLKLHKHGLPDEVIFEVLRPLILRAAARRFQRGRALDPLMVPFLPNEPMGTYLPEGVGRRIQALIRTQHERFVAKCGRVVNRSLLHAR